jgi:uncharacterized SAM-binding protein YcdF (DUF218 family)
LFFFLSKTLDVLFEPWWWAALALLTALVCRKNRVAFRVGIAVAVSVPTVFSLPLTSNLLWHQLEMEAARLPPHKGSYQAVVILGGAIDVLGSTEAESAWNDNQERLWQSIDIVKGSDTALVIVSGASGAYWLPSEAELMARVLRRAGIAEDRIVLEERALNTEQNAQFVEALLRERHLTDVLIVTSAYHIPRAKACFTRAGVVADYAAVDFRMRRPWGEAALLPRAKYFARSTEALREFFGRAVYAIKHLQ